MSIDSSSRFRLRFLERNLIYLLLCLGIALALTILISKPGYTDSQNYVLFLLFFSVGLWLTEAVPPFAVSLFIMAFLVFTLGNPSFNSEPQDVSKYVATFSSSVIWLMLGGFFLARAMSKTRLDEDLLRFSLKISGSSPKRLLMGLMLTTMVASMLMSNTATTAMIIASLMPLLKKLEKKSPFSRALLVGIPLAASVGGMGTIIGSPANAISAAALENVGGRIEFLQWMYIGVPLAIALTMLGWFALAKKYLTDTPVLSLEFLQDEKLVQEQDSAMVRDHKFRRQRILTIVVIVVTVLLWMTSSLHNLSVSAVSAIPIVVLSMRGIIGGADVNELSWDTLLLVAGGLSLGIALQETGLLAKFAGQITNANMHPIALICLLAYITMILSNIMSSTAAATILVPLAITLVADKTAGALIVGLTSSLGLMLPVSTPPNAIAYSTGQLDQKDFRLGGLLIGLVGPALVILWVLLLT